MINLYDGNNVMRRAMERHQLPQARPMTIRQRFEASFLQPEGGDIWVWDGYNHNARRRDIYPNYKANRPPIAEDIFAQIKLWKEVLGHTPAAQIEVSGWEADDVIGTMAQKFARRGIPVNIHTNDMDYGQLLRLNNVKLVGVDMKGIDPRWIALYKAVVGDKSDSIDGIPNFGHKRWEAMRDHWPQMERAIRAGSVEGLTGLPFTKGVIAWLQSDGNIELLQNMLLVTHMHTVPDDELEGGTKLGKPNRLAGHARLSEFFL